MLCEQENTNGDSVYIGKTENILERLLQHISEYNADKEKFYWYTAIAVVGQWDNV